MKPHITEQQEVPETTIDPHIADANAIIAAIRIAGENGFKPRSRSISPAEIGIGHPQRYQQYLCERFGDVIGLPSFDYISKTAQSWLVVGDRRAEIAAHIRLLIERYGLGVGMLVLHLQQVQAGHLLASIEENGIRRNLAATPDALLGNGGESLLYVPLRQFREDYARLAAANIVKPAALWDPDRIVTHESDAKPCAYCSCAEINPAEVVVDIEGSRHGLSRNYSLGFTFAPFGNPLTAVHFLAWDQAHRPLNMNRVPMTVSDLVKMTRDINGSIRSFFSDSGVPDIPSLDGISNGWAGNSVFHQHFQFFIPAVTLPILRTRGAAPPLVHRDDVHVTRLDWLTPVYRIQADDALNTGLVGNDMAGIWRLLGGSRISPYRKFHDGDMPGGSELVPSHTQNVHVSGAEHGRVLHLFLRDRARVDYEPDASQRLREGSALRPQSKKSIGAIEVSGCIILDNEAGFATMREWSPDDIACQARLIIASVAPDKNKVAEFEAAISELFPS